jgi:uncharacterized protein with HEPN domain
MKSWQLYAHHILECIQKIELIQERGSINEDSILYDATLRNLQTLSEATQRLPDTLKATFPDIPWKQISGFRNILVHEYLGKIDATAVQRIITEDLPSLENVVKQLLDAKD